MSRIIAIRPPPGDAATVALAKTLGLEVESHPLFAVEPMRWQVPAASEHDALLIGSANALRHGGPGLAALYSLPAHCVGQSTADAARVAGFAVASVGTGGLQRLLPQIALRGHRRLLRLAGEAHVPLESPAGMRIETCILYRVRGLPVAPGLAARLSKPALVLLHSGEAAAHFAREIDRLRLPRAKIALACLAPRIAAAAGGGWRDLRVAASACDAALLALAREMCQTDGL